MKNNFEVMSVQFVQEILFYEIIILLVKLILLRFMTWINYFLRNI